LSDIDCRLDVSNRCGIERAVRGGHGCEV
jgi:hypothetical protein